MAALLWSRITRSFVATVEDEDSYSEKLEVAGVGGKACVGPGKDCSACKCCNVTGFKCYLSSTKGPICLDSIAEHASSSPNASARLHHGHACLPPIEKGSCVSQVLVRGAATSSLKRIDVAISAVRDFD